MMLDKPKHRSSSVSVGLLPLSPALTTYTNLVTSGTSDHLSLLRLLLHASCSLEGAVNFSAFIAAASIFILK